MAAGPAGKVVGRVTIRVAPDVSKFREELEAKLGNIGDETINIKAKIDLDTTEFQARIDRLRNKDIRINATVNVRNRVVQIGARLKVDTAHFRAQIARLSPVHIQARIDVDEASIAARVAAAIRAGIAAGGDINPGVRGFGGFGGEGGLGGSLGTIIKFTSIAAALVPLGAAITAAYGAAATAISMLPAALSLVAVPIATITLGLDGIKKAAKTLKPEFDALKKSVSDVFEKGFTKAFNTVRHLFADTLTPGFTKIAGTISDIANEIAGMLTTADGMTLLRNIFNGVDQALRTMIPGIKDAADAFLILLGRASVFETLGQVVNEFGRKFRAALIDNITDGSLDSAILGLGSVLSSLTDSLVELVHNGIEIFAQAAPGVKRTVDAINGFFARFDYKALGQSVSDVFDGIAQAIEKVPDQTIRDITAAFVDIGKKFQDPKFISGLTSIIKLVPRVVEVLGNLTDAFVRIGGAIADFINGVNDVKTKLDGFTSGFGESVRKAFGGGDEINQAIIDGFKLDPAQAAIQHEFALIQNQAISGYAGIVGSITDGTDNLQKAMAFPAGSPVPPQWRDAGIQVGLGAADGLRSGIPPVKDAAGQLQKALVPLGGGIDITNPWGNEVNGIGSILVGGMQHNAILGEASAGVVGQSLAPTAGAINIPWADAFLSLGGVISTNTQGLSGIARQGAQGVAQGATEPLAQVPPQAATALAPLGAVMSAVFGGLSIYAAMGMAQVADGVAQGGVAVSGALTNSLLGLAPIVQGAFGGLAIHAAMGMALLAAGVTQGMVAVTFALQAGMLSLAPVVQAGFGALSIHAAMGMALLAQGVTQGMVAVTFALQSGLLGLGPIVSAGFGMLAINASIGMAQVAAAVTTGFVAVAAAFTIGFSQVSVSLVASFLTIQASASIGMAGIALAVSAGMATVIAAFVTGMAVVTASWVASWALLTSVAAASAAQMSAAVQAAIAGMVASIQSGMAQAVGAIQAGVSAMVGILNGAVGAFRAAGANMGAALAAGLESQLGRVQAAAARLAQAAAAATAAAAQIHSPSRVFIKLGRFVGFGFAYGIERCQNRVKQAALTMTETVIGAAEQLHGVFDGDKLTKNWTGADLFGNPTVDHTYHGNPFTGPISDPSFGNVGDRVAAALEGWEVRIDANGIAKLVNKSNTRRARR